MNQMNHEQFARVCRILDGEAPTDDGAESLNPEQQKELRRVAAIDDGLKRMFRNGLDEPVALPTPRGLVKPPMWARNLAACIALAVIGTLMWHVWVAATVETRQLNAVALYRAAEAHLVPTVVCDTPEKFEEYTRATFGETVTARFDQGATLIGWRGVGGYTSEHGLGRMPARVLLATDNAGTPVIVLFQDRLQPRPLLNGSDDLSLHKRRFGRVVAWEITPLAEPLVLDALDRP